MNYPLAKRGTVIGVPFQGTHTLGDWQSDRAIDISVPVGTPMVAAEDGVVVKVTRHPQDGGRFAGDQITIRGASNSYFYAHGVAGVRPGQRVSAGQMIGTTGSANGVPHLHIGVEHGDPRTVFGPKASVIDNAIKGAIQGVKAAAGVAGPAVSAANTIGSLGGGVVGGAAGVAGDAATAGAKAIVNVLWDTVSKDAARASLYVLLVGAGIVLAVTGVSRATGLKPGRAVVGAATTVLPAGRAARAVGAAAA